jgi:hypothetical protein
MEKNRIWTNQNVDQYNNFAFCGLWLDIYNQLQSQINSPLLLSRDHTGDIHQLSYPVMHISFLISSQARVFLHAHIN